MQPTLTASFKRIESMELLQGVVMMMALDHTHNFFHKKTFTDDPLNFRVPTPFLYFMRWIRHLWTSAFVFFRALFVASISPLVVNFYPFLSLEILMFLVIVTVKFLWMYIPDQRKKYYLLWVLALKKK